MSTAEILFIIALCDFTAVLGLVHYWLFIHANKKVQEWIMALTVAGTIMTALAMCVKFIEK